MQSLASMLPLVDGLIRLDPYLACLFLPSNKAIAISADSDLSETSVPCDWDLMSGLFRLRAADCLPAIQPAYLRSPFSVGTASANRA